MESSLSRLLVGLSVQISRSDGELMLQSIAALPNKSVQCALMELVIALPFINGETRSCASGDGEVRRCRQVHCDGGMA